ncbi:rhomboid family intramembrane serine protease [Microbacterium sp. SYP-A9085]|uniref:rhomboid family intramembrane serine protease n=1 Tax=Microbacterium sp. SYP-A9085 TaxID=2664454 RepID=UPI00129BA7AD|nr:rhomboid family intramembrane serine protease [Microbacterium sp. SYP-A9085]MRH28322.1 rhomboid family intramembrane serine protease [Microbacterium sp. SYP-A9085]
MTTADFARNRDNFCYRHPDRQSFVLCQRCLRTICPECQIQAPVGVICPECLRDQQKGASTAQRKAERRWGRRTTTIAAPLDRRPLITYGIIAVTVLVYLAQLVPGSPVQQLLAYNSGFVIPQLGSFQPWRLLTVLLVHSSWLHIGLNMLALWMIGRILEPLVGRVRFLVMYLISGLAGSVAVALLAPLTWVVGASGAIFGLFGALLVIGRHIGANVASIAIIIAINFAFPFVVGILSGSLAAVQISWQAHLGGLIAGAAVGFIYARTRTVRQRGWQIGLLIGLTVLLLALLAIPATLYV